MTPTQALSAERLDELIGTWKAAMRMCEFDEYKLKSRDLEDFVTAAEAARQAEMLAEALEEEAIPAWASKLDMMPNIRERERLDRVRDLVSAYRNGGSDG